MTIDLQTLKCGECGSSALKRTGLNQYACQHCGSVTLVEDNVSDRLERVLEQVKDAAGERLAQEQSLKQKAVLRNAGIAVAAVLGVGLAAMLASLIFARDGRPPAQRPVVAAAVDRSIPVEGLRLGEPRQVLVGNGGSAQARLLVVARNETGKPLERAGIKAVFYDGDTRIEERSETVPIGVLQPGESAPVLIDLPSGKTATRQELQVQRLSEPYRSAEGPRLAFERVRLVQQGTEAVRLVGRIAHAKDSGATLAGIEALVTLYDDAGRVIGIGHGYAQASELKPGARTSMDMNIRSFGRGAPVAAWDYRIGYSTLEASGARVAVLSADRVVRAVGAPEVFNPELRMGTEDLLADESERFDPEQLELLALVPGLNTIRQRTYMTELVNRSKDRIAIAPAAVISRYDGSKLDGTTVLAGPAYLYPGERFPVQVDPSRTDRITQTRVEWKPMRRAALPGQRTPLEVTIESTRATTGSVLLNFSQRFAYKAVDVKGSVRNPGAGIVRKARVWVSLRDREGRLTGFKMVENLPAIGPGESAPFEVSIQQQARDFATVDTVYQSTE